LQRPQRAEYSSKVKILWTWAPSRAGAAHGRIDFAVSANVESSSARTSCCMLPRYQSGGQFSYFLVLANPLLHKLFANIHAPRLWQLLHRLATYDGTHPRHSSLGLQAFPSIKVSVTLPKAVKLPSKPYVWTQPYLLPPVQTLTYIIRASPHPTFWRFFNDHWG
jgi:hypothetical protein